MSSRASRLIVWGLLGITLLVCAWLAWRDRSVQDDGLQLTARSPTSASKATHAARADAPEASVPPDLFPPHPWNAPAKATVSALPPVRPASHPPTVAAPLFEVAAVWRYDAQPPIVVLAQQGHSWVMCAACDAPGRVRPGDTFAGGYRLDRIDAHSLVYTLKAISRTTTLALPTPDMHDVPAR
ncbi:hypothetical protein PAQ31011_01483 [Pandoraea aquatica]|uniref:Uncharacterized protein n=1 Tax=Pandoraea aquatica TaxID=2508290 RepID=A0A5E4TJR0_9BURK|nr:hypothetical protein [Pandoraea aquatica]VVD88140.1 hypothetical protein PAQ31011_01483 [Pandoraea aquatica]